MPARFGRKSYSKNHKFSSDNFFFLQNKQNYTYGEAVFISLSTPNN